MCEAHSKVTHAKQQNVFITPKEMDVIRSSYYIHGPYIYIYTYLDLDVIIIISQP